MFAIGSALAYLLFFRECATPPHVQVHDLVLPGLLPALVLQATNAGMRRPVYEATWKLDPLIMFQNYGANLYPS